MFARILCLFYLKFSTCCQCIPHRYSCYNSILHLSHAFTYYKMCSCAWWSWTLVSTWGVSGCEQMRMWEAQSCLRQSQQRSEPPTQNQNPNPHWKKKSRHRERYWRCMHQKRPCKVAIHKPRKASGETKPAYTLIWNFQPPGLGEN